MHVHSGGNVIYRKHRAPYCFGRVEMPEGVTMFCGSEKIPDFDARDQNRDLLCCLYSKVQAAQKHVGGDTVCMLIFRFIVLIHAI